MSLDELFAKEFRATSQQRAGISGALSLYSLPLPESFSGKVEMTRKVIVNGINDQYYSKLNKTECIHWTKPNLRRRRFGSDGQYIKGADGKVIADAVTLPQNCAAVVSTTRLAVPLKYKPKEAFDYVDFMSKKRPDGSVERRFVYIVPKCYCYAVNQLALVLSLNKLRTFYYGQAMVLQSGHTVYMYVIPFKPSTVERSYRILKTKTRNDFGAEIDEIMKYWLGHNILYPIELTSLSEPVKGMMNVAYHVLSDTQDEFVRFDPNKSLADTAEEMEFI